MTDTDTGRAPAPAQPSPSGLAVRDAAVRVLSDVFRRERFADEALDAVLAEDRFEGPDRALLVQLVYGTLRRLGRIDYAIDTLAAKGKAGLSPEVVGILRVALFQILFLDRVPAYAAVFSAVEQIKQVAPGLCGLVNAVLRRAGDEPDRFRRPAPAGDALHDLALAADHPRWLVGLWAHQFGPNATAALCEANNREPTLFARANPLRGDRDAVLARLAAEGVAARPHPWFDDALVLPAGVYVGDLACFREGWFVVQDASAMIPARLVAPAPGEVILDACAAPGGKTTHLAALSGCEARIVAIDRDPQRLLRVKEAVKRLGLRNVRIRDRDATKGIPGLPKYVDAVLVDAPCSGLGTLRRRLDLRWRLEPDDLVRLAKLAYAILDRTARKVRPGGRLVFSTCTINPGENHEVVEAFLRAFRRFEVDDPRPFLPAACHRLVTEQGYVRTFPHVDDVDGSFAVRLVRRESKRA